MSGFLLFCFFTLFVVRQVVVLAAVFPVRCGSDLLRVVFIVIANFAPANLLISVFLKWGSVCREMQGCYDGLATGFSG